MIQTWPTSLPRPERNSWQSQPQDARRKRQPEMGPPAYRRRFSRAPLKISLSLVLTRDLKAVFDGFFHDTCAEGSLLFRMPDPTTDGWAALTSGGAPILAGDGSPILLSASWLCAWGDQLPVETVTGVEFRTTFSVVVMR